MKKLLIILAAATPRQGTLLYKLSQRIMFAKILAMGLAFLSFAALADTYWKGQGTDSDFYNRDNWMNWWNANYVFGGAQRGILPEEGSYCTFTNAAASANGLWVENVTKGGVEWSLGEGAEEGAGLTIPKSLTIGTGWPGILSVKGGDYFVQEYLFVADGHGTSDGGNGFSSLTVSNCTFTVNKDIYVGRSSNIANGALVVNEGALIKSPASNLYTSYNGGTSTITLNGGTIAVGGHVYLGCSSGAASQTTVRIADGGLLTMSGIYDGVYGTANVTIDGGTIRANKNNETLIPNSDNLTVTVGANGGTINSHRNAITIAKAIGGTGGLTFTGSGTITLSGAVNYSGATAVTPGTVLAIANSTAKANIFGTHGLVVAGVPIAGQTIATYTAAMDDADLGKVSCSIAPATTFKFSDETKTAIVVDTVGPTSMFTIDANGVLTGVDLGGATEVVIPYGVTAIGNYAFFNCPGLTSVTIPESVTSIGEFAFYECRGLTSVTIPDSVTSIGRAAFRNCSGLKSVTIPDGVTSIGTETFFQCSGLKSVMIPDSVTSIGDYAFAYCSGLTSVTIPDGVTSIGSETFVNCTGLTSVTIPDSVTSIRAYAFAFCSGLTSVTIGNSVTSIGNGAFRNCSAMTNVVFMGNAPTVGTNPFDGVASGCVASVSPESTGWGDGETWNGLILQYYNPYARFDETGGDSEWTVEDDDSWKSGVINHSQNTWAEVSVQGPCVVSFEWKVSSESNFDKLHVYLDGGSTDKVPAISGEVDWTQTSFGIDDSAEHTVRWTYTKDGSVSSGSDCGWVRNVSVEAFVPEPMFIIDANGVLTGVNLDGATEVVIPDSVTSIGANVFENCGGLTSVTIPNSVTNIGEKAFLRCRDLTSITIPDSVTNIGKFAFYECTGSTSLSIGNGVTSIGEKAFYGCSGVTSLTIPESVTTIGDQAFGHCYGLTSLTIPDNVTSIGIYAFFYCTGLESVTIGNGLTVIASSAFSDCTSLTSVTIPDSVTEIGEYALCECTSLTSVTIPASVTVLGDRVFYESSALTNVVFKGNAPTVRPWSYDGKIHAFDGVASGCVASVSPESTGWGVEVGETWNGLILQYWPKESGYDAWAEDNGITGAMDETSGGVYNVFRYVFDVPSGAFEETPLIDIAFVDGKVVVKTPPVVNSDGVTVSVVESSDVAGKTVTATKAVDAAGSTEFTKSAESPRFYRLSADVEE